MLLLHCMVLSHLPYIENNVIIQIHATFRKQAKYHVYFVYSY